MFKAIGQVFPKFDTRVGPILVTGAQGVVAYRVAVRLIAAGHPKIRLGVTDTSSLPELAKAEGVEVVEFNWEKSETYKAALVGINSVFISIPHIKDYQEQFAKFMSEARASGVAHFVKLSVYHALSSEAATMGNFCTGVKTQDPFLKVPLVLMHRELDAKLMKTPRIDYTLLFASHFMSNPTVYQSESLRKEHKFCGASGGKGVNYVSPNDVADVAVHALLAPKEHSRVGYTLTGPTAITDHEVAMLLGKRMNVSVIYQDEALKTYSETAQPTDWGTASDVAYLEYAKSSGVEEKDFVTHDISKVCGHPAESYEAYLLGQDYMTLQEKAFLKSSPTSAIEA